MVSGDLVHGQLVPRRKHHGGREWHGKSAQFMVAWKGKSARLEGAQDQLGTEGHASRAHPDTPRSICSVNSLGGSQASQVDKIKLNCCKPQSSFNATFFKSFLSLILNMMTHTLNSVLNISRRNKELPRNVKLQPSLQAPKPETLAHSNVPQCQGSSVLDSLLIFQRRKLMFHKRDVTNLKVQKTTLQGKDLNPTPFTTVHSNTNSQRWLSFAFGAYQYYRIMRFFLVYWYHHIPHFDDSHSHHSLFFPSPFS